MVLAEPSLASAWVAVTVTVRVRSQVRPVRVAEVSLPRAETREPSEAVTAYRAGRCSGGVQLTVTEPLPSRRAETADGAGSGGRGCSQSAVVTVSVPTPGCPPA